MLRDVIAILMLGILVEIAAFCRFRRIRALEFLASAAVVLLVFCNSCRMPFDFIELAFRAESE